MPEASSSRSCPCPPAPPRGTLYIFLHGLIGIADNPTGLDLLIPNVGAAHSYRYGEFLGEVTLQPSARPYQISGICSGSARFNPAEHLVTKGVALCDEPDLYARICLPLPAGIHSVRQVDLSGVMEDPAGQFSSKIATMVPVLEYQYEDPRRLLFGCDPLNVAPVYKDGNAYINLHIFAEEDAERLEDHDIAGFDAVTSLFKFACAPRLISLDNLPVPGFGPLPPGTTRLEFLSLSLRTQELGYLGRLVRTEILEHSRHVLVEVSPVGADPVTCTPLVSQS